MAQQPNDTRKETYTPRGEEVRHAGTEPTVDEATDAGTGPTVAETTGPVTDPAADRTAGRATDPTVGGEPAMPGTQQHIEETEHTAGTPFGLAGASFWGVIVLLVLVIVLIVIFF